MAIKLKCKSPILTHQLEGWSLPHAKVVGFGKPVTEAACFESLIPHAWLCVGFLLPNS